MFNQMNMNNFSRNYNGLFGNGNASNIYGYPTPMRNMNYLNYNNLNRQSGYSAYGGNNYNYGLFNRNNYDLYNRNNYGLFNRNNYGTYNRNNNFSSNVYRAINGTQQNRRNYLRTYNNRRLPMYTSNRRRIPFGRSYYNTLPTTGYYTPNKDNNQYGYNYREYFEAARKAGNYNREAELAFINFGNYATEEIKDIDKMAKTYNAPENIYSIEKIIFDKYRKELYEGKKVDAGDKKNEIIEEQKINEEIIQYNIEIEKALENFLWDENDKLVKYIEKKEKLDKNEAEEIVNKKMKEFQKRINLTKEKIIKRKATLKVENIVLKNNCDYLIKKIDEMTEMIVNFETNIIGEFNNIMDEMEDHIVGFYDNIIGRYVKIRQGKYSKPKEFLYEYFNKGKEVKEKLEELLSFEENKEQRYNESIEKIYNELNIEEKYKEKKIEEYINEGINKIIEGNEKRIYIDEEKYNDEKWDEKYIKQYNEGITKEDMGAAIESETIKQYIINFNAKMKNQYPEEEEDLIKIDDNFYTITKNVEYDIFNHIFKFLIITYDKLHNKLAKIGAKMQELVININNNINQRNAILQELSSADKPEDKNAMVMELRKLDDNIITEKLENSIAKYIYSEIGKMINKYNEMIDNLLITKYLNNKKNVLEGDFIDTLKKKYGKYIQMFLRNYELRKIYNKVTEQFNIADMKKINRLKDNFEMDLQTLIMQAEATLKITDDNKIPNTAAREYRIKKLYEYFKRLIGKDGEIDIEGEQAKRILGSDNEGVLIAEIEKKETQRKGNDKNIEEKIMNAIYDIKAIQLMNMEEMDKVIANDLNTDEIKKFKDDYLTQEEQKQKQEIYKQYKMKYDELKRIEEGLKDEANTVEVNNQIILMGQEMDKMLSLDQTFIRRIRLNLKILRGNGEDPFSFGMKNMEKNLQMIADKREKIVGNYEREEVDRDENEMRINMKIEEKQDVTYMNLKKYINRMIDERREKMEKEIETILNIIQYEREGDFGKIIEKYSEFEINEKEKEEIDEEFEKEEIDDEGEGGDGEEDKKPEEKKEGKPEEKKEGKPEEKKEGKPEEKKEEKPEEEEKEDIDKPEELEMKRVKKIKPMKLGKKKNEKEIGNIIIKIIKSKNSTYGRQQTIIEKIKKNKYKENVFNEYDRTQLWIKYETIKRNINRLKEELENTKGLYISEMNLTEENKENIINECEVILNAIGEIDARIIQKDEYFKNKNGRQSEELAALLLDTENKIKGIMKYFENAIKGQYSVLYTYDLPYMNIRARFKTNQVHKDISRLRKEDREKIKEKIDKIEEMKIYKYIETQDEPAKKSLKGKYYKLNLRDYKFIEMLNRKYSINLYEDRIDEKTPEDMNVIWSLWRVLKDMTKIKKLYEELFEYVDEITDKEADKYIKSTEIGLIEKEENQRKIKQHKKELIKAMKEEKNSYARIERDGKYKFTDVGGKVYYGGIPDGTDQGYDENNRMCLNIIKKDIEILRLLSEKNMIDDEQYTDKESVLKEMNIMSNIITRMRENRTRMDKIDAIIGKGYADGNKMTEQGEDEEISINNDMIGLIEHSGKMNNEFKKLVVYILKGTNDNLRLLKEMFSNIREEIDNYYNNVEEYVRVATEDGKKILNYNDAIESEAGKIVETAYTILQEYIWGPDMKVGEDIKIYKEIEKNINNMETMVNSDELKKSLMIVDGEDYDQGDFIRKLIRNIIKTYEIKIGEELDKIGDETEKLSNKIHGAKSGKDDDLHLMVTDALASVKGKFENKKYEYTNRLNKIKNNIMEKIRYEENELNDAVKAFGRMKKVIRDQKEIMEQYKETNIMKVVNKIYIDMIINYELLKNAEMGNTGNNNEEEKEINRKTRYNLGKNLKTADADVDVIKNIESQYNYLHEEIYNITKETITNQIEDIKDYKEIALEFGKTEKDIEDYGQMIGWLENVKEYLEKAEANTGIRKDLGKIYSLIILSLGRVKRYMNYEVKKIIKPKLVGFIENTNKEIDEKIEKVCIISGGVKIRSNWMEESRLRIISEGLLKIKGEILDEDKEKRIKDYKKNYQEYKNAVKDLNDNVETAYTKMEEDMIKKVEKRAQTDPNVLGKTIIIEKKKDI